jgi:hypothetical protein
MRVELDSLAEIALGLAFCADIVLFFAVGFVTADKTNSDPPAEATAWRLIWSALAIVHLLWYVMFRLASRNRWDAEHYNSYRMYIISSATGALLMALFAWLDRSRDTLTIFTSLALSRTPLALNVLQSWWLPGHRPLGTDGYQLVIGRLQSGYYFWHTTGGDIRA